MQRKSFLEFEFVYNFFSFSLFLFLCFHRHAHFKSRVFTIFLKLHSVFVLFLSLLRLRLFKDSSIPRLVDGPSKRPNIGRVQVQYDNILTDVCFEGDSAYDRLWTRNNNLKVLCTQLGYPGALMTSNITTQNTPSLSDMFTDDYKCGYSKFSVS